MMPDVVWIVLAWIVWTLVATTVGALIGYGSAKAAQDDSFRKAKDSLDEIRDKVMKDFPGLNQGRGGNSAAIVSQPLSVEELEHVLDKITGQGRPPVQGIRMMGTSSSDIDEKWMQDLLKDLSKKHDDKKEEE